MPRCIDAPVFSYWQALYMAFYSRRLYLDVGVRWRGVGFFYLFLMLAVASIPLSARLIHHYNQFISDQIIAPLATIPPLELQNGIISFNQPMPYFVKSKTGSVVAMIDTRTNGTGMDGTYPELMLLVTRDKFYVRPPQVNLFPDLSRKTQDRKPIVKQPDRGSFRLLNLSEWLESSGVLNLKWVLAGLIYPFTVSFLFGLCFSFFLIFAMFAQVYSWVILKFKMRFSQAIRLLIVSSTVQVSVCLFLLSFNVFFQSLSTISLLLCLIYFSYAVLSVKRDSQRLVRT